ncbi:MAG: hypothetical protein M5U28_56190 [Sandaracinaceae bacterium]|nr:hypothetical protein [Sandaracinaceae bacterium]
MIPVRRGQLGLEVDRPPREHDAGPSRVAQVQLDDDACAIGDGHEARGERAVRRAGGGEHQARAGGEGQLREAAS